MKRILIAAIIILVLLFIISGCSNTNANKQFNKYIKNIDKEITEVNKFKSKANKYIATFGIISKDDESLKKVLDSIDKMLGLTEGALDHIDNAIIEARQAKSLDPGSKISNYAQMLEKSFETRAKSFEIMKDGFKEYKKVIQMFIKNEIKTESELKSEISPTLKLFKDAAKIEKTADEEFEKAQKYYARNVK